MPAELQCRVEANVPLTPTVFQLSLSFAPQFEFVAGQYISIVVPGLGPGGRDLRRPYSIASVPGKSALEICIKLVPGGPGTQWLKSRTVGDTFKAFAPYGSFGLKSPPGRPVVFLATGTGISPFRSILLGDSSARSVKVLLGVSGPEEVLYQEELSRLQGVTFIPCVSKPPSGWDGYAGRLTRYLREELPLPALLASDFYACGNGAMIDEAKALLIERGLPAERFFREIYYKTKSATVEPSAQKT